MDFFVNYHGQRLACWPAIEQFFGLLAPDLFRQAVLLKTHLGLNYSNSGRFRDIFTRSSDHPLLYLHFWLMDDWNETAELVRGPVESHLVPAGVLSAAAYHLWENIPYEDNIFDESYLDLIPHLLGEAQRHLMLILPAGDPFWQQYQELGFSRGQPPHFESLTEVLPPPSPTVFARLSVVMTGLSCDRGEEVPDLLRLVDELNQGLQLYQDLLAIRRDIYQSRPSGAILKIMALAGIDRQQSVTPQQLLGAFVLHGVGRHLCDEALTHTNKARDLATKLSLPTFDRYLNHLAQLVAELETVFTPKKTASTQPKFLPYSNALNQVITAAESYLLADRLFQSSWAVQRGFLTIGTLTARAFPAGMVVENLCRCEHRLTDAIDRVFSWLQASEFRYYDDFLQLPPDADDLGLLLRLYQFSTKEQQARYRNALEQPLLWMQRSILPSGEIPVWFATGSRQTASIQIWGHSCATTEINLLLGLLEFDEVRYQEVIQAAATSVIERFLTDGLAASLYYVQPYTVWSALRLLENGRHHFETPQPARSFFAGRFDALVQASMTPQTAAFLLLSQQTCPALSHDESPWLKRLLKSQRHDGSWEAEPLFLVPHRLGVGWYASRLVTSSYCYMALKQCV